jgi:hypothetical protein
MEPLPDKCPTCGSRSTGYFRYPCADPDFPKGYNPWHDTINIRKEETMPKTFGPPYYGDDTVSRSTSHVVFYDISIAPDFEVNPDTEYVIRVNGHVIKRMNTATAEKLELIHRDEEFIPKLHRDEE